jgi:hypothetical protein
MDECFLVSHCFPTFPGNQQNQHPLCALSSTRDDCFHVSLYIYGNIVSETMKTFD